jgi:hypothetical protein
MYRPLTVLLACCFATACGSGSTPSNFSNNPPGPPSTTNFSMRFFGTGSRGLDRVKIPLLNANGTARPVNIGATDFTLEFWINGTTIDNPTPACTTGRIGKDAWLNGAVVVDRDVLGDGDFGEFGVALFNGQVAFGVTHGSAGQTLCGSRNVLDGAWHHLAVTRERMTGDMRIFVDGAQDTFLIDPSAAFDVDYNPAHPNPDINDPFLVLGAEKRDLVTSHAFNGLIDELRLSTMLRYPANPKPSAAFVPDADTAALYHFDEATGTDVLDASNGNASPGLLIPASAMANHRSTDTPF